MKSLKFNNFKGYSLKDMLFFGEKGIKIKSDIFKKNLKLLKINKEKIRR
jgi:hypothetical protein